MLKSRRARREDGAGRRTRTGGARREGNVTEIVYTPIKSDATRIAALLSGEVDFVLDPPPQDVRAPARRRRAQGDRRRREPHHLLRHGPVPRRAAVLATSRARTRSRTCACARRCTRRSTSRRSSTQVMRGLSHAHRRASFAPQVNGWTEDAATSACPYDAEAREEAAGRGGLSATASRSTLDCPNNRYINDEEICQAVAAMWAQIGVKAKLNAMPRATYFPKIQKLRHQLLHAGLGRADVRRAVHAADR